jgi:hypothetical protein
MVYDILEQAPPTPEQLRRKPVSDETANFLRKSLLHGAHMAHQLQAQRQIFITSVTLVTFNIIQSVALWARGSCRKGAD